MAEPIIKKLPVKLLNSELLDRGRTQGRVIREALVVGTVEDGRLVPAAIVIPPLGGTQADYGARTRLLAAAPQMLGAINFCLIGATLAPAAYDQLQAAWSAVEGLPYDDRR